MKPIFIHVPRTGGTSIRAIFKDHIRCYGHQAAKNLNMDSWSFAFVRNPYERATSWYHRMYPGNTSQIDFAQWCCDIPLDERHGTLKDCMGHPSNSTEHLLTDSKGHLIVDQVYQFESYAASVYDIAQRLDCGAHMLHLNKRKQPKTEWQSLYSDVSSRAVHDLCEWEVDRYGY